MLWGIAGKYSEIIQNAFGINLLILIGFFAWLKKSSFFIKG